MIPFHRKRDRAGNKKAPLWKMAINYYKHTQKVREYEREHGDAPLLPDEDIAARVDICMNCPYLVESDLSCSDCGCPVAEKAEMSVDYCPYGEWEGDPPVCEGCSRIEMECKCEP